MVQVRQQLQNEDGSVDIQSWFDLINQELQLNTQERDLLWRAAEQAREWEQSTQASETRWQDIPGSFLIGLEMSQILADLHLDIDTLIASVLYRAVREEKATVEQVETLFGERVARLIQGVLRMAAIGSLRKSEGEQVFGQSSDEQIDNVRKMLLAIIDDVRVALLKIAERTCVVRALKNVGEDKRRRVAREVMDIYAPLAHRLGLGQIKWELEDIAFRYLEPYAYQQIASLLDEKRVARENFIHTVINTLQGELQEVAITGDMSGRAKHIYSIWRKMRQKDIGFSQVYDIRAVRILVTTVHECYMVLGIVHGLWRRIPNEFDDYIANPKENGYKSLHTAVIGPEGKVMEIQIRTQWMHEEAEFGVCAHWQYKKDEPEKENDPSLEFEEKVEWLRQVLEWHEETGGGSDLIDELRSDVIHQKMYVFTPDGDVVELPQGATPLDFAYHVHTGVGHRCRGARVNGRIVPLNHELQNSDQVEVLTGKHEVPNREWLAEGLGYIKTARARSKIHQWFRHQAREQNIIEGSISLDRELKRLDLVDIDLEEILQALELETVEDLYATIGASDIEIADILAVAQNIEGIFDNRQQLSFEQIADAEEALTDHNIIGVGNLPVIMADCCGPREGDVVSGLIRSDNIVVIHKQDCATLLQVLNDEPLRSLQVQWGVQSNSSYMVDIEVEAYERRGLLRDISELFDREKINIVQLKSETEKLQNTVTMAFTVEITSLNSLSLLLAKLGQIPNIYLARRRR